MKSKSTGLSPAEMLFGFKMRTPSSWGAPTEEYEYEKQNLGIDRIFKVKNQEKILYYRDLAPIELSVEESIYKSIERTEEVGSQTGGSV
ncbi:hypothetical protein AYI70_g7834 [Smittium culicis]|uniref:Uncharacterized protein n=1 Tax=Smittium culicis TaxID=133412 RepID=A0A1R1XIT6_9FUNG|nr:hypothetical protein AYI70_g7834 [Smittium culicis]